MSLAIECIALNRTYTSGFPGRQQSVAALDSVDLQIPEGVVFGLLGPNGAGKTTMVRILATLLAPTAGTAKVLELDVMKETSQVRQVIGLVLGGERGLYGRLSGRENLQYFGAINRLSPKEADSRADELLEHLGLKDAAKTTVDRYSRGMKQRLHIARGLMTDPKVIFLDEPTLGLDPAGAQYFRGLVSDLARSGKTILLTTHYMLEADLLCQELAIINRGQIIAQGTPQAIKGSFSKISVVEATIRSVSDKVMQDIESLDVVDGVTAVSDGPYRKVIARVRHPEGAVDAIVSVVGKEDVEAVVHREPTLEEAYLSILS